MKTSVIIPAYNAEATLAECLASVVGQQCRPFEVIVVNDGSTDATERVARAFENDLPLTVLNQANAGLGAARNAGMRAATGTHWAFLDADDLWSWNKLAEAERTFERTQCRWLYTPIFEWSTQTGRLRPRSCDQVRTLEDFLTYNPIVPSTVVMDASLPFLWEENRQLQEDVGAYLALFAQGHFPTMQQARTTKYRLDFGMTAQVEDHHDKVMRAVEQALERGHLESVQYRWYVVRKAYELARTFKKRGDTEGQKIWKRKALQAARNLELPRSLRWKLRWLV